MRLFPTALIVSAALAATAVFAANATDPNAKARQELMDTIGMNVKILGDMAGGKAAFDATAAAGAKAALIAAASEIPVKFKTESTDPASKAKPDIWANWDKFKDEAGELSEAAEALDTSSVETVQAGLGAIGGVCKDCHTTFRN